jgi:cation diffusion facilitator CzcD-associated flavoprotein CzcO
MEADTNFDVIIIGAGLSGVNTAYQLQMQLPDTRFAILEGRDCIGGTWAFWKYPGVRSDSAMSLFGLPWYPWPSDRNMPEATQIQHYLEEAASSAQITEKIRFRHRVVAADWTSEEQRWRLTVQISKPTADGREEVVQTKIFTAGWMISCSGYYDYDKPLPTVIPGIDRFQGEVVHPQFWHEGIDHAAKDIVIIGSGATAVTLLPALAKTAKSVTILQRSPSYVLSLRGRDRSIQFFKKWLPVSWALTINWWLNMMVETLFVQVLLTYPKFGRKLVMLGMKKQLPPDIDIDTHFNPRYSPFQQRLCFCPDSDFFKALHRPNCNMVTDTIETVTENGILLKSGTTLGADMIVTATGLYLRILGGIPINVDGQSVRDTIGERFVWNGSMLEGVPNAGSIMGYTAGTWTPGADCKARMLIKVMKRAKKTGAVVAMPHIAKEERAKLPQKPSLTNTSTYITTALSRLPMAADVGPWRNGKNWLADTWRLMFGNVTDGIKYTMPAKMKDI